MILASEPPESELHSLVVRLRGFHAEMSFLGCIGHVMSGSGLQELLEVVYSPNTVTHILSGKAVARAVRGHLLIDSALNAMVGAKAFNTSLPEVTKTSGPADPESDERQTSKNMQFVTFFISDIIQKVQIWYFLHPKHASIFLVMVGDQ